MPPSFLRLSRRTFCRTPAKSQRWLSLMALESRCVPAVIAWDGGPTGNGTNWLTAANWAGDVLPGASDDVTFGPTGTNPIIELRGDTSVQSVTNGRRVRLIGNDMDTDVILTVGSGGFTNNDRFELSSEAGRDSTLTVNGGVLLNPTGRTISTLTGVGGDRRINLNNGIAFTNQGTLSVAAATTITLSGGSTLDNPGRISVVATNLAITLDGGAQALTNSGTVELSGGSLFIGQQGDDTFTTTGSIVIGPQNQFSVFGGALNYQAGSVGGGGTLAVNSGTLNLASSVTTAALALSLRTAAVNGPGTLTNGVGQTSLLRASDINAPWTTRGRSRWKAPRRSTEA